MHKCTYSCIHSFAFIYACMHASIDSFSHSFIHSFSQSFSHSFTHSFTHPRIHSFVHLFIAHSCMRVCMSCTCSFMTCMHVLISFWMRGSCFLVLGCRRAGSHCCACTGFNDCFARQRQACCGLQGLHDAHGRGPLPGLKTQTHAEGIHLNMQWGRR